MPTIKQQVRAENERLVQMMQPVEVLTSRSVEGTATEFRLVVGIRVPDGPVREMSRSEAQHAVLRAMLQALDDTATRLTQAVISQLSMGRSTD